jgi:hypothetical protein
MGPIHRLRNWPLLKGGTTCYIGQSGHNSGAKSGSPRFSRLIEKFKDREYRQSYMIAHTRRFLARQMRKFRGDHSQEAFAEIIGKKQTQVWRLEDPAYGKHTLQTLFDVAGKLDVAVLVRLVDYRTFLKLSDDLSDEAFVPLSYEESEKRAESEPAGDAARAFDKFQKRSFDQPPPGRPDMKAANENTSPEQHEFDQRRARA